MRITKRSFERWMKLSLAFGSMGACLIWIPAHASFGERLARYLGIYQAPEIGAPNTELEEHVGTSFRLMDRHAMASTYSFIFGTASTTGVTDDPVFLVMLRTGDEGYLSIRNRTFRKIIEMGGACDLYDAALHLQPDGTVDADDADRDLKCDWPFTETGRGNTKVKNPPDSNTMRAGILIQNCDALHTRDEAVRYSTGLAGINPQVDPPSQTTIGSYYSLFFPGKVPSSSTLDALIRVGDFRAQDNLLEKWRRIMLSICLASNWQAN